MRGILLFCEIIKEKAVSNKENLETAIMKQETVMSDGEMQLNELILTIQKKQGEYEILASQLGVLTAEEIDNSVIKLQGFLDKADKEETEFINDVIKTIGVKEMFTNTSDVYRLVNNPSLYNYKDADGNDRGYCWCRMTHPASSRWVFNNSNSASNCASNCANNCGNNAQNNAALRSGLFGSVGK